MDRPAVGEPVTGIWKMLSRIDGKRVSRYTVKSHAAASDGGVARGDNTVKKRGGSI